ncbi:unnamed protein product [Allacma fusca]|uniref:Uncharacterized protein n=1 Tax=Allacma fusca TaxID=39272 RepID=A0A8J2PBD9_9HEXA|nr:unnamed protein product [Allacma fusca]
MEAEIQKVNAMSKVNQPSQNNNNPTHSDINENATAGVGGDYMGPKEKKGKIYDTDKTAENKGGNVNKNDQGFGQQGEQVKTSKVAATQSLEIGNSSSLDANKTEKKETEDKSLAVQNVDEQMVGKVEAKLKTVIDEAAKHHKKELNDIYKDDSKNDQLGFKDSDIRKHHEAIRDCILIAFDKTFEELWKITAFRKTVDLYKTKLGKTMDMQLLLCIRRQEISLEKLLMQVKLATCQAEDIFDSWEKSSQYSSVDEFNKEFSIWKDKSLKQFQRVLQENKIKPSESWEYELKEKLKEKEEEWKPKEETQNKNNHVTENETYSSSRTTDDPSGTYDTSQPENTNPETKTSRTENKNEKLGEVLAAEPVKNNNEVGQKEIGTKQPEPRDYAVGSELYTNENSPDISTSGMTNRGNDEELTKNKPFQQVNNRNETADPQEDITKMRQKQDQPLDNNREINIQSGVENTVPKSSDQQESNQKIHSPKGQPSNSRSDVQSNQASAKTTAARIVEQEYQNVSTATVRSTRSIDNVKNDFECKEVDVGIYLDSSQLLVGAYYSNTEFKELIPGDNYLLDMANKRLELNPNTASRDKIIGVFQELFKNSQLDDNGEIKGIFTLEEIVPALLAAVDTKLKESEVTKHRAKRFALTALSDIDETQQEIITKAGRGHDWEFRYIPYQSATIIGHYSNLQKNLPSTEETNIVARVKNNYLEACKVTVFTNRVTREVSEIIPACNWNKQDGSSGIPVEVQKLAEKLELSPLEGQRFYILEGENLTRQTSLKNENELKGVYVRPINDFPSLGLHGVSFLATKEEQEFKVYDRKREVKYVPGDGQYSLQ